MPRFLADAVTMPLVSMSKATSNLGAMLGAQ
jgi:hypothetical protein